ncbi:hypothetical protein M0220_15460 [Halomonas qinghailakensis]|uniref:Uncharacterized protein n=1 Tax=Halomonas qinghailakensis TaxID=2937790 RepID=A0AA46TPS0_9GAMM|nr:hypothetical protein [Halomonas sp. ZZQ-149]UYO74254.1 hypothetical protein M0220_15460 [Halomonas sp. ZZQ-149]
MNDFNIKVLTPDDWALYKSVRLESLNDSPDSFGSTYEQESILSNSDWQARLDLNARKLDALPLVAEQGSRAMWLDTCARGENRSHLSNVGHACGKRGRYCQGASG